MSEPLEAAPGPLDVVREFINTVGLETGGEQLSTPASASQWLTSHGLLGTEERLSERDVTRAIALRESLRTVLDDHRDKEAETSALERINEIASRARLEVRFTPEDVALEAGTKGMDGALGRLLAIVSAAMADGTWTRLKVCGEETCRWAFYDHSRNRSRNWCDMALCGNRAKARTYRERQREHTTP